MRQLMVALRADADELRQEIALGPTLLASADEHDKSSEPLATAGRSRARRVIYVSGLISVYGLLEEYIDRLVMQIGSMHEQIYDRYSQLPESMRTAHREYSLRSFVDRGRVRLREAITEDVAMQDLAACLADKSIRLNVSVFTYATANYRHDYIMSLLGRVDVQIDERKRSSLGKGKLETSGLAFGSADALIKDLVQRRNEVAHSYSVPDLLDAGVLSAYLAVIEGYLADLITEASEQLLRKLSDRTLVQIGTVKHLWSGAIGVDMISGEVVVPSTVLLIKPTLVALLDVSSLQSGGQSLDRVTHSGQTIKLGMGTTDEIPTNASGSAVYLFDGAFKNLDVRF